MEIALGYDAFRTAVEQLRDAATELEDQRTALAREVDGLLDAGWRGEAASSFAEAWDDWVSGADDVVGALTSLASAVAAAGRSLSRADERTGTTVDQLRGRLGA